MASKSCYCCKDLAKAEFETELDKTLNELEMLGTMVKNKLLRETQTASSTSRITRLYKNTDNRQQGRKNNFEVIHFNPQYITQVTIDSDQPSHKVWLPKLDFGKDYRKSISDLESDSRVRRLERCRLGRIRRFRRPYEVPWRLMDPMPSYSSQDNEDSSDLQSKSNSSSPVKYTSSCTLPRSRSFDNMNFAMLQIATDILEETNFSLCKQEIETVSANMRNLQVTE